MTHFIIKQRVTVDNTDFTTHAHSYVWLSDFSNPAAEGFTARVSLKRSIFSLSLKLSGHFSPELLPLKRAMETGDTW